MEKKLVKKIEAARDNLARYIDFLTCPLCGSAFGLREYSLVCADRHAFDLAKKGYANLFSGYTKIGKTYDRPLFEARKIISDAGLYSRLAGELCRIIAGAAGILDAGCGCGNLTHDIFKRMGGAPAIGVDLSKEGIEFAAANFCERDLIWLVANLNNLPFADAKFDAVLNIMSPANYLEFKRVLKPGGVLLKVMPDADYLKELRRFIYGADDRQEYSNSDVLANLRENTRVREMLDVSYTHMLAAGHAGALFDMTPLTSSINERERVRQDLIAQNKDLEVTAAFKIAVCEL